MAESSLLGSGGEHAAASAGVSNSKKRRRDCAVEAADTLLPVANIGRVMQRALWQSTMLLNPSVLATQVRQRLPAHCRAFQIMLCSSHAKVENARAIPRYVHLSSYLLSHRSQPASAYPKRVQTTFSVHFERLDSKYTRSRYRSTSNVSEAAQGRRKRCSCRCPPTISRQHLPTQVNQQSIIKFQIHCQTSPSAVGLAPLGSSPSLVW